MIAEQIREPARLISHFPSDALRLFNYLGASVRFDERLELHLPSGSSATYDRQVRKRLVLLRDRT